MNQPIVLHWQEIKLKAYMDKTSAWRKTDQLFVCFNDTRRDSTLSKQKLVHWVTQVISHAYESVGKSAFYTCFGDVLGSVQWSIAFWVFVFHLCFQHCLAVKEIVHGLRIPSVFLLCLQLFREHKS